MENILLSKDGEFSIGITSTPENVLASPVQFPVYTIVLIPAGTGQYKADFGTFDFKDASLLFSTPLQTIQVSGDVSGLTLIQFHGDIYCIEYHKQEVACNGVLFNNIYTDPVLPVADEEFEIFRRIIQDLSH